jgi:ketosteroid isomerase-like protein
VGSTPTARTIFSLKSCFGCARAKIQAHGRSKEFAIPKVEYTAFEALDPFFRVVERGLSEFVDGEHYFDMIADDALFEFRYKFPGWPETVRGRANLIGLYSGYGNTIRLNTGDNLVVHPSKDGRVVILEYEVHGKILATGAPYDNRFVSVVTIANRKIAHWRDYMDSLAAWTALNDAT